eukprot:Sspe_Gene.32258::Locus_15824_Transcript_1_1_Confidence_1.000_Length_1452::g.32258::m.32258/K00737/MGAT3; beta-1,4-mannosyl-glycoprotein beta-1,4-N-acetylglucosaminyltransferase
MWITPWAQRRNVYLTVAALIVLANLLGFWVERGGGSTPMHMCDSVGWTRRSLKARPVLWDITYVNHELKLLYARMKELDDHVDGFIVVESNFTFSGTPKQLHFRDADSAIWARFERFRKKIHHVVVTNDPVLNVNGNVTEQEKASIRRRIRSAGIEALPGDMRPTDYVLMSDVDEVPSAEALAIIRGCLAPTPIVSLHLDSFIYDFGCIESVPWKKAKVVQRGSLEQECNGAGDGRVCLYELRNSPIYPRPAVLPKAGWHMSWFLTRNDMLLKLKANGHLHRNDTRNAHPAVLDCYVARCLHLNLREAALSRGSRVPRHRGPRFVRESGNNPESPYFDWFGPMYHPEIHNNRVCATVEAKVRSWVTAKTRAGMGGKLLNRRPTQHDLDQMMLDADLLLAAPPKLPVKPDILDTGPPTPLFFYMWAGCVTALFALLFFLVFVQRPRTS